MAAALAGAESGLKVVLVEASPLLGGRARLFGTKDGEETPERTIERQTAAIAGNSAIAVITHAEVFALRPGRLRLHRVDVAGQTPTSHVIDIAAPHIVLATGALERLPLFPGNRLPGVTGALEALELAQLYGVWPGRTALLATGSSPAYRLAMLASDAGIAITRIIDSRPQPQSRFIAFSRAYGITQAAGTIVASAAPATRGRGLLVSPQLAMEGLSRDEAELATDRLVVCGGWQPDLTLWHMAGGESLWQAERSSLQPGPGPAGIALAGSAAGWITRKACLASGVDALERLLGRTPAGIEDRLIDPIYETPDAPAAIGVAGDAAAPPAYLDAGRRYIERPRIIASRWPGWLSFLSKPAGWSLADTPQPLDIADIAAGVQLGAIPAASAGIVAQERVAMVLLADEAPESRPAPQSLPLPPDYLRGRYRHAQLFRVAPNDARQLETGALIYADADETDPLRAIGVVVRVTGKETIALVAGAIGQTASLREPDRTVAITLLARYPAD
jgi:sarcosine oxidase subunit alpha